jgi:multidrug efflux system outer membrane protein
LIESPFAQALPAHRRSDLSALDAQRTFYSAQQQLQIVRLTRLQNLVTLYKTLGGGLLERGSTARPTPQPSTR